MPGLYGIVGSPHDAGSHDLSQAMCARMRHHAWYQIDQHQDDSAGIALGRVSLGFIQTQPQPVWNHDRSVCLLLEGEIYGEAELRHELANAGSQVHTSGSHAELLLHGYLQEGRNFFRRVNGTFVAAIWEARHRRLILVNDRFGMKPLYYALLPDRLLFASEIKSLLADAAVPRDPDPRGISQFFSFGQLLGEDTLLRAVKALPPAAWVTYRQAEHEYQLDRYWQLSDIKVDQQLSQADFLERIDTAFAKAVELRTSDTAGLGISLSGGLDSRSILAAIDHRRTPIKSVSMGMRGSLDHRCAQQLSAASNGDHFCYLLDDRFLARYEHFMRTMVHLTDGHYLDQCIVIPTLPTYQQLGIQVLLRGHAGELLHMDKAYNFSLDRDGWSIRDEASLRAWLNDHMRAYMLDGLPGPLFAQSSGVDLQALAEQSLADALRASEKMEPTLHRIWHLFITERLRRETAMSMAKIGTLFETRLPFLDNEVVAALLSAPPQWKRGDQIQAYILAKRRPEFLKIVNANTGAPLGASRIRQRATHLRNRVLAKLGLPGYQPYERLGLWLRRELRTWVEDVLLSPQTLQRGMFEPQTVKLVVQNHMEQGGNHTALLLAMLIFELGQREFIDGEGFAAELVAPINSDHAPVEANIFSQSVR